MKTDVKGGECEVLKGGERLFSEVKPTLVCEIHHEQAARWIAEWPVTKGYAAEWLIPRELFPRPVVGQALPVC
jgi:hypothetical protein